VKVDGKTFVPRQGNNSYIFPGVGLGAIASGTRLVTDEMFMAAAHTLAHLVSEADLKQGSLYPALPRIREVSTHIAVAVAEVAYKRGLTAGQAPKDVRAYIQSAATGSSNRRFALLRANRLTTPKGRGG
jgi:malate dehydrogenase (oxaloacetate-decarboxylating)(NADP+)